MAGARSYAVGEEMEVNDWTANRMIKAGIAEAVIAPKKKKK